MAPTYLVGIDGSEGSGRAFAEARALARVTDSSLIIAHVIDWSRFEIMTPEELEMRHVVREQEMQAAHEKFLASLLTELKREKLLGEAIVRHGSTVLILNEIASEKAVNLIFVGRRGISRMKDLLFGSVARGLAQSSPVAVVVVP